MSRSKFASITANLLARKGEARPWAESESTVLSWPEAPATPQALSAVAAKSIEPGPFAAAASPGAAKPRVKSCTVRMSHDEYEKLSLLAVKRDQTRQQVLQAALKTLMADFARDHGCACIGPDDPSCCGRNR